MDIHPRPNVLLFLKRSCDFNVTTDNTLVKQLPCNTFIIQQIRIWNASISLTTAAGATASISITDASITATSKVFAAVFNGTNSAGSPAITTVTPGLGAATVVVQNIHASAALNGTLKVIYFVVV